MRIDETRNKHSAHQFNNDDDDDGDDHAWTMTKTCQTF